MAQPHKGDRVAVLTRVPRPIAQELSALNLVDRNAWVVSAIEAKLAKDRDHAA